MKEIQQAAVTLALAVLACAGTGCSRQGVSGPSAAESRVFTVDDYLRQPELRRKVFAACANDPGRKSSEPNCVNALSAERIAAAGTGRFPGVTP